MKKNKKDRSKYNLISSSGVENNQQQLSILKPLLKIININHQRTRTNNFFNQENNPQKKKILLSKLPTIYRNCKKTEQSLIQKSFQFTQKHLLSNKQRISSYQELPFFGENNAVPSKCTSIMSNCGNRPSNPLSPYRNFLNQFKQQKDSVEKQLEQILSFNKQNVIKRKCGTVPNSKTMLNQNINQLINHTPTYSFYVKPCQQTKKSFNISTLLRMNSSNHKLKKQYNYLKQGSLGKIQQTGCINSKLAGKIIRLNKKHDYLL